VRKLLQLASDVLARFRPQFKLSRRSRAVLHGLDRSVIVS
jgi:hypothetical protein